MPALVIHGYGLATPGGEHRVSQGKFIQLRWGGQEHLVFASSELHDYHNQILAHFLADHGVAHHWLTSAVLEVDDREPEVVGGGRFRVDLERGTLDLWDDSHAYGRFDERGLAARFAAAEHPWRGLVLRIA